MLKVRLRDAAVRGGKNAFSSTSKMDNWLRIAREPPIRLDVSKRAYMLRSTLLFGLKELYTRSRASWDSSHVNSSFLFANPGEINSILL